MAMANGIMAQGAGLLQSLFGEPGAITYKSAGGLEVVCDAIVGSERGGIRQNLQTGDVEKVTRRTVKITKPSQLLDKGITGPEKYAVVVLAGKTWPIEVSESIWSKTLIKLVVILPEILRNEGMSRGTV